MKTSRICDELVTHCISVLFTTCRVVLFTAASFDIKARLCGISMPLIFTLTFHKGSCSTALPLKWTFRG